jgi:hypothetical protein
MPEDFVPVRSTPSRANFPLCNSAGRTVDRGKVLFELTIETKKLILCGGGKNAIDTSDT